MVLWQIQVFVLKKNQFLLSLITVDVRSLTTVLINDKTKANKGFWKQGQFIAVKTLTQSR
jgi:hypothetical protein